mgnify:CR=1 FL=1
MMKAFKYIVYSFLGVMGFTSCDLVGNINDIKPEYILDEKTLIRDARIGFTGCLRAMAGQGIEFNIA